MSQGARPDDGEVSQQLIRPKPQCPQQATTGVSEEIRLNEVCDLEEAVFQVVDARPFQLGRVI